jgi:tetratricopeptide (TPR) repeat protein
MSGVMRSPFLTSCACAALVVCPGLSAGQDSVADSILALTTALDGTFGDEGALIVPALDRLDRAIAEWDRSIRDAERRVTSEVAGASPGDAIDLRLTLARMYVERGRRADAMREIEAAGRLEPRRADVMVLRDLVAAANATSVEAFSGPIAIEPRDPVTAYYLLRSNRGAGDGARPRATLAAAYQTLLAAPARPAVPPFIRMSPLERMPDDVPVLPLARYAQGYAQLAAGHYDGARAALRRAAADDPLVADPAARSIPIMRAVAALRDGRLAEARALVDAAAPPGSSEAHRIRGLIRWASGDVDRSLEQFTLAIDRNPRDERSRLARARVLSSAGRHADAERELLATIRLFPESVLAHWWLGLDYEQLDRRADARREVEAAAAGAIAGRARLLAALGRLAAAATDVPAAIEAFRRGVDTDPNDPAAHAALAGALLQQDRADDALVEFVAALLIDPLDGRAHAGIGRIHLDAGRHADAAAALTRAVDLMPGDTDARYALATAFARLGRSGEAAREFDRVESAQREAVAERRRSMAVDVLKEEAAMRAAEGSYLRAVELYERAVALGRDAALYEQLAELYSKLGRSGDAARARALAREAVP